jgi:hypothetical protein
LVTDLHQQASSLDILFEMLLLDDASQASFREINSVLQSLEHVNYAELTCNVGRSAIRNQFAIKASYPYLLFIDNDAQVCSPTYISTYLRQRGVGVICYGGCSYALFSGDEFRLRWLFGTQREAIPIDRRSKQPNDYFSTFNFMIDKRILLLHPFNEQLTDYGYEDVLFKIQALHEGYHITQVDNPMLHTGLDSNDKFLTKTIASIEQLNKLHQQSLDKKSLEDAIQLLGAYRKIERLRLTFMVSFSFRILKKMLKKNVLSKKPSLLAFDIYKLGYLCNLKMQNT